MWEQYIRDLAVFGTNADRADPAALRRRRRQPALPAAAAADDGRDVADRRRLRPRRLDLVSGDGRGLRRPEDGRVRAEGVGRGVQAPAADRRRLRPRRRPRPHRAEALFALLEKQAAKPAQVSPEGQMWVSPQGFTGTWMDEFFELMAKQPAWLTGRLRPAGARSAAELRQRSPKRIRSATTPTSRTAGTASIPVPDWDLASP